MYDPNDHVVHSVNGNLHEGNPRATTSREDIRRIVEAALTKHEEPDLVVHFHGGLVDKKAAYDLAERLYLTYNEDTRYPIFFAWEAGFIEAIRNNLKDISQDRLFQQLVKRATWWVLRQLPAGTGLRGAVGAVDRDEFDRQFDAYFAQARPVLPDAFDGAAQAEIRLRSTTGPVDLATPDTQIVLEAKIAAEIEVELTSDFVFKSELEQLHDEISSADVAHPTPKEETGIGRLVTKSTEIAPEQVDTLFDVSPAQKGVFTVAKVAWFLAKVVVRVVRRLLAGRGHGIYTTVVEEILAGVYIDKIGGVIWQQMKKDTADAFGSPTTSAGAALLDEIRMQQQAGKQFKRITLIGHSTGAVYICNLLAAAATLLPDQKFDVVFLAPAVTYEKFARTLRTHAGRIAGFRRFCMLDDVEIDDMLVPVIYPRSLLYFISGVLEFTDAVNPDRIPDAPLAGMHRYDNDPGTFDPAGFPDIHYVDSYVAGQKHGSVWSVTAAGTANGLVSHSRKHGDFDNDPITVGSIAHILEHGL